MKHAAITLVRHGQASFGSQNYDNLSEMGCVQSKLLGDSLRQIGVQYDVVFTGGLQRHDQTRAMMGAFGVASQEMIDSQFTEIDSEALLMAAEKVNPKLARMKNNRADLGFVFKETLSLWADGTIIGGETWEEYNQRVQKSLNGAMRAGNSVLVVTSGGVIASAAAFALGLSASKQIDLFLRIYNSSVTTLVQTENGLLIETLNSMPHMSHPDMADKLTYV